MSGKSEGSGLGIGFGFGVFSFGTVTNTESGAIRDTSAVAVAIPTISLGPVGVAGERTTSPTPPGRGITMNVDFGAILGAGVGVSIPVATIKQGEGLVLGSDGNGNTGKGYLGLMAGWMVGVSVNFTHGVKSADKSIANRNNTPRESSTGPGNPGDGQSKEAPRRFKWVA